MTNPNDRVAFFVVDVVNGGAWRGRISLPDPGSIKGELMRLDVGGLLVSTYFTPEGKCDRYLYSSLFGG